MDHILVVDDDRTILTLIERILKDEGYQVTASSNSHEALELLQRDDGFDLIVSDLQMPGMDGIELLKASRSADAERPFIFVTGFASSESAIEALKLGAFDYITKPFIIEEFKNLVRNALVARTLKRKVRVLETERMQESPLVGISLPMLEIYKLIGAVSVTQSTVLIIGESGTGKELIARAIHDASPWKDRPFVSINCGAFPETLLESELFGYVKGAFTGAVTHKKGLFEAADGGTLFLDEVGEMSPAMQVKILRALQDRKIRRVGGTEEISVSVRVIAATNRSLEKEIENGNFREDLYYRLAVIPIQVPPLRERKGDVPALVHRFIQKYNRRLKRNIKGIAEEAVTLLEEYAWPGNVRELENIIERAMTLENSDYLQAERLPEHLRCKAARGRVDVPRITVDEGLDLKQWLEEAEKRIIEQALLLVQGNQTRAAQLLRLSYPSLRHRLQVLKIRSGDREEGEAYS
ncbi:MAG: sigma-54-dependent Fis family transcriptional regulator [Acidobacteria bacterium]|nr:sigma-54-dependent Fis family transcriptional regulator [Acidobacteriota bacterium]